MCLSKTKSAPPAEVITTPQTGYSFVSPYMEDYSRRLLGAREMYKMQKFGEEIAQQLV